MRGTVREGREKGGGASKKGTVWGAVGRGGGGERKEKHPRGCRGKEGVVPGKVEENCGEKAPNLGVLQ